MGSGVPGTRVREADVWPPALSRAKAPLPLWTPVGARVCCPGCGVLARGRAWGRWGGAQAAARIWMRSRPSARLWPKPQPRDFRVWRGPGFRPSLLLDGEAGALGLREAQPREGRNKACSGGGSPESGSIVLRAGSLYRKPERPRNCAGLPEVPGRERIDGARAGRGAAVPREPAPALGPREDSAGPEPGEPPWLRRLVAVVGMWVLGARGQSFPGTRLVPAPRGLGRGVSARVCGGGAASE